MTVTSSSSPADVAAGDGGRGSPLPAPSLPRGGVSVHALGERLDVDPATGSLSVTVPLPLARGRGASAASLSLVYRAGAGNSVAGLGWSVPVGAVSRRTQRGVPRYDGTDTFTLAGEELVPYLVDDGAGGLVPYDEPETIDGVTHRVRRYLPRTVTDHGRVEQCVDAATGEAFWRTVSRDNVTRTYGRTEASRVHDPRDPPGRRFVAEWLLDTVHDDLGNVATYEYKPEDLAAVPPSPFEQPRLEPGAPGPAAKHLKRVRYANTIPDDPGSCAITVVLDYGEHDLAPDEVRPWPCRRDPFSLHRYGFEVRTYRLLRRLLVFHDFGADSGPGPLPRLVRSLELTHDPDPVAAMLRSVRQVGYRHDGNAYTTLALAPVDLDYGVGVPATSAADADLVAVPEGSHPRWVDLDGDGMPGVLHAHAGAWWYQAPAGAGRFAPPRLVRDLPVTARAPGTPGLGDVDGTGRLAATSSGVLAGSSLLAADGSWDPWRPFTSRAVDTTSGPGSRLLDADGDGLTDLLTVGPDRVACRRGLGRDGFDRSRDSGGGAAGLPPQPAVDAAHEWFVADLTGDGLADLVHVANGLVEYWPGLGPGRYGPRVRMAAAPRFDTPDQFDPARVRLADVTGTGTCDLLYVGRHGTTVWHNRSGNSWSDAVAVQGVPAVRCSDDLQVADLLGTGTPCLVWTSSLPQGGTGVRYLPLCTAGRPRALQVLRNNRGATTTVTYGTAAAFRLADRVAGQPWRTRLAGPLPVVVRTAVVDEVSGSTHTTHYRYRESYLDPDEREQRGFGRVEVRDADRLPPPPPGQPSVDQPAGRTVTWYDLGAHGPVPDGVFTGDPAAGELAGHDVVGVDDGRQRREALRSAAGRPLRTEVYGDDGGPDLPFSVTRHRVRVTRVQPPWAGRPGVYRVDPLEVLESTYDRVADDPREVHTVTLETDGYGAATSTARIAYPRRLPAIPEQSRPMVSWSRTELVNTDVPDLLRLGVVVGEETWEVTGLPVPSSGRFDVADLVTALPAAAPIPFESTPNPIVPQRRRVEASRAEFWDDTLVTALPPGQVGRRALQRRLARLAFTPGLLLQVFGTRVTSAMLTGEAGYTLEAGSWWAGNGVVHPDPAAFYQPTRWTSEFGNVESVTYDSHGLLVVATRASSQAPYDRNAATFTNDYAALCPVRSVDANGTTSEVELDPLGRVVRAWLRGADGAGDPPALPGLEHSYGSTDWHAGIGPVWAQTRTRERPGDAGSRWQTQRVYADGAGRIALTKTSAAPGPALADDGAGGTVLVDTSPAPRWIGSGRTVFSTRGQPVQQFHPYFSATPDYESADALVKHAVAETRAYDALGRLVRLDLPDGTFERTEFGPWSERQWDRNDTVTSSRWFAERQQPGAPAAQQRAATLAAAHAGTPTVSLTDALGRVVRTRADNGAAGIRETVLHIGIQGDLRGLTDSLGRRIETQVTDALGRVIATSSVDAGDQAALPAADGRPARHWGPLGHGTRVGHDPLRRQTHLWVAEPGSGTWRLDEFTVHGETHPQAAPHRLVGRVHRRYDQSGLSRADAYDIGGRLVAGQRRLARATSVDWTPLDGQPLASLDAAASSLLDPETFSAATTFDAQGRPIEQTLPDGTVLTLDYDAGGQVAGIRGRFGGVGPAQSLVTAAETDAQLRRTRLVQGSGTEVSFDYDDDSGRLRHLRAAHGATVIEDLTLVHDPVGNLVQVDDAAQQAVFFAGAVVEPVRTYEYDPLYHLVSASGREHASLAGQPDHRLPPSHPLPHPNDANALRRYTETYDYDPVGNIRSVSHAWSGGGWVRRHTYLPGSNRLDRHSLPGDPVAGPYSAVLQHDAGGQVISLPGVGQLSWDHAGRVSGADLGGGGTLSYAVDGTGERVRQVWLRAGGMREERLHLGALEIFRRYVADVLVFERRTVTVVESKRTVARVETVTVDTHGAAGGPGAPVVRYQIGDHLGSVAAETDAVGTVISYEEYHPFGTTALWLARGAAAVSTKRYRYTGREHDDGTGLYHCGERLYAAWLGRWTSPDHAGLSDGANRFAYVNNNPVRLYDPTGRDGEDLFAKPSSPWAGTSSWGSASGEQLWFSESKAFWAEARATDKGRGFTKALYEYFRQVHRTWGGPAEYALGHQGTPFALLRPGEDSWIAIQSVTSNAVQANWERQVAGLARDAGLPVRDSTTGLFPGAAGGTRWGQPDVPTFRTLGTTPTGMPEPLQLPLQFGPVKPLGPEPPPMLQLEINFDVNAAAVKASGPSAAAREAALGQDAAAFAPAAQDAATATKAAPVASDAATASRAAPLVTDTATASKAVPGALDTVAPVTGATAAADSGAVAKVATSTSDATVVAKTVTPVADAASVTPLADAASSSGASNVVADAAPLVKDAELAKDAAAVVRTDASVASTLEKGAEAVKVAAPVVKEAAPVLKEAGAMTKVVGTGSKVLKAVAPVVKVAGPVLRVVGEVAKPLAVVTATADLATANNNTDRLVAGGDLVAGISMYCGPVGEAFGAGYTVGGLLDKGIEKASKATLGVDLSPSNGLSYVMDAQDKLISRLIPDSPDKPAYKNENKVAWFLIDTLGF